MLQVSRLDSMQELVVLFHGSCSVSRGSSVRNILDHDLSFLISLSRSWKGMPMLHTFVSGTWIGRHHLLNLFLVLYLRNKELYCKMCIKYTPSDLE
jgi:hypothetical protein